ncbi:hypothetical protein J3F83DRAFT_759226 [Trichoderma novae-zelandiae]
MTAVGKKSDQPLVTFPAIFKVDLLFPHNATYAPSPLMPIVFAMQNPALTPLLALITFDFNVPLTIRLDIATKRKKSNKPLLLSAPTIAWTLEYSDCSNNSLVRLETSYIVFTVSKSGQAPDLEAATSADVYGASGAMAFNLTKDIGCGVPGPSATTNPCAVIIDSAAASSLSALARAMGYVCSPNSNLTCPTSFPSSGSLRVSPASTLLTLLAALAALIHLG